MKNVPTSKTINIGRDFSRFPVGRYLRDGDSNGQLFREDHLTPAITNYDEVVIELDDALGYGSSFLEEAFGGLIRVGRDQRELKKKLKLQSSDDSLKNEIWQYIDEASAHKAI